MVYIIVGVANGKSENVRDGLFQIRAQDFWKQWIIRDRGFTTQKIGGKSETPRRRKSQ